MHTHATSRIGETGLKIFNGFLIFFNGFTIFLNGFPIFLNSFLLSEKSKKIYLRQEVYKRSLFELCIFCHSLSHSRSELCNTRYNTQHGGIRAQLLKSLGDGGSIWGVPMSAQGISQWAAEQHNTSKRRAQAH
jgi:hypothetical protein